jgi:hypothetical protein
MMPKRVAYGEGYSDGSGWKQFLSVDAEDGKAMVELSGADAHLSLDDLWWLVKAAMAAREALGMDKLVLDGPSPTTVTAEPK